MAGRVEVVVGVGHGGVAVGVCYSEKLNVMYWWKVQVLDGDVASAAVAAIRLWGQVWEEADSVFIRVPFIEGSGIQRR